MKYKFTTLLVGLCLVFATHAQTYTDSIKAMYDSLPAHLYPSGLLHNRSPLYNYSFTVDTLANWQIDSNYIASPYLYPGHVPAKIISKMSYGLLFNDMYHSSTNPLLVPNAQTYRTRDSIARLNYEVPIAAVHLNFQQIKHDALVNGYLYFDTISEKYIPMPDTIWVDKPNNIYIYTSNPDSLAQLAFTSHSVYAGALTSPALYKEGTTFQVTFGLSSSLFVSNQTSQISNIEMDFDNGQGFQPIEFDLPYHIAYTNAGSWESYERILRLRMYYGSNVVETRMPLVIVPNAIKPDTTFYSNSLNFTCPTPSSHIAGISKISIKYGNPAQKLLKPILLLEGFEEASDAEYGSITMEALMTGVILDKNNKPTFQHAALLSIALDSLLSLGYDLVYVDNANSQLRIEQHALNAIKTIQWINGKLIENGSNEKLVVLGASMGGLVARYTLAKMEADGCCHNTRTYITFDTPHNGAHIPLGLQYAVRHLKDNLDFVENVLVSFGGNEIITPSWNALNSPGARQMLVAHIENDAATLRNNFMAEFDSLGHPKECVAIAISNGSETGLANTVNTPSYKLLHAQITAPMPVTHFIGLGLWPYANIVGVPIGFNLNYMSAFAEANVQVFEGNNAQIADLLFRQGWSIHSISASTQIILKVLGYKFPIFNAPIVPIQTNTSAVLSGIHLLNAMQTLAVQTQYSASAGFPNYTEAPGGTNDVTKTIVDELNKLKIQFATAYKDDHCFIPTVSSLDIDTNDLYLSIKNVRIPLMFEGKIPFDSYWAPGRSDGEPNRNMKHIEVTKPLYRWLIEHIDRNYDLRHPQTGAYHKTLAGYYNFGRPGGTDWDKPFLKHLYSVDVVNGGNLYINKYGNIGFNTSNYSTDPSSGFNCYTGQNCEQPYVNVQNGGTFWVGEGNNKANMYFQTNSTLEIQAGGILRINDNSKLVLEPGAELIIHPGAVIDLAGPNAVLELQGKVTLLQNAVFSPTGSGFVRFAQAMQGSTDAPNYWSTNGQAQVRIVGSNGQKRAEVVENLYLTEVLDSVVFSQANTQIAAGKELHLVNVPVRLANSSFSAKDTTALHNGVHLYGQKAIVQNTRFSHGTVGLQANLNFNTKYIYLNGCTFTYNQTGVYIFNGGFIAEACTARYNQTGLQVFAATGNGLIQGGVYAHNTNVGIDASSAQNGQLTVLEAAVNNNTQGIHVNNMNLRSECSNISYNTQVGIAAENCFVQLQAGAQNQLLGNTYAIGLFDVYGIFLEDGLNDFSGSTSYINGNLTPINANPDINVNDNKMPGSPSALPIFVWFNNNGTWVYLPVVNWNSTVNLPTSCAPLPGLVGNTVAADAMRLFVSGKVINTTNYSNIWLHDALANAALLVSTSDNVYNDLLAIARFDEIFASISGSLTEMEMLAIEFATQLMVTALNNVYD